MNLHNTGNCNNRSDGCFFYLNLVQTVKLIKLADLNLLFLVRVMMVQKGKLLVHRNSTAINFTNTDTSNILIVINCTDQYLSISIRVSFRSRDVFQNCLKQRLHVLRCILQIQNSMSGLCRCIQERTVKLLIRSTKVHQKLKYLIYNLIRSCFRTVYFVNADDYVQIQLKSFFQNEFGLRHGTFESINQKDNAVYHFQYTLNLAAEVSMSWGIDNVDLCVFVMNCCVLGENCDTTLSLNVIRVHDTFLNLLVGTENTALLQQLVYQCGFTMVNVGNDGYVTYIFAFRLHKNRNPFFIAAEEVLSLSFLN